MLLLTTCIYITDVFILHVVQVRCIYITDGAIVILVSISESASVEGRWSNVIPKTHLKMVALKFLIQDKNI